MGWFNNQPDRYGDQNARTWDKESHLKFEAQSRISLPNAGKGVLTQSCDGIPSSEDFNDKGIVLRSILW